MGGRDGFLGWVERRDEGEGGVRGRCFGFGAFCGLSVGQIL
jgi:hypothetical protein